MGNKASKIKVNLTLGLALGYLMLLAVLVASGSWWVPDSSPNTNRILLSLGILPPMEKATLLKLKKDQKQKEDGWCFLCSHFNDYEYLPISSYRFDDTLLYFRPYSSEADIELPEQNLSLQKVYFNLGGLNKEAHWMNGKFYHYTSDGLAADVKVAELQELIVASNIVEQRFVLGTDHFGRDVLSRLVMGGRNTLLVGLIAVSISLIIGLFLGSLGGYYGGWIDRIVMWLVNVVWSLPTLLLVLAISVVLGKGFWQVFVAVGLTMWVEICRVVRGQVKSIKEEEFVEAAKGLAFRDDRIILRHVLPQVYGVLVVLAASNFATAVLLESGLSFLGLGVSPPAPSWGLMLNEYKSFLLPESIHLILFPGLLISITVWSFYIIGNALRDYLDVKA